MLDAARDFFEDSQIDQGGFHTFRRDVGTVRLWEKEIVPDIHPETGYLLFYIPVTLFSKTKPKVGLLMIPKTCAYMWLTAIMVICRKRSHDVFPNSDSWI